MARRRKQNWDKTFEKMEQAENKKAKFKDEFENLYKPSIREDGTGSAIIRFLEPPLDEDLPFVKRYNHMWSDTGGWYSANCPTTISGQSCPVCKENGRIWEQNENLARKRSRKAVFYANILVIRDPENPENEGKVFLYKYGLKIHAKIMSKVKPEDPLDTKINVFDYEVGANFKLKIKQQNIKLGGKEVKVPNYDSSEFSEKTPVVNPATNEPMSDEELDALDEKLTALAPIVGKDKFKSYDELAVLFTKKTGIVVATSPDGAAPVAVAAPIEAPKTAALATKVASAVEPDEEDDDDAFLNSLRQ